MQLEMLKEKIEDMIDENSKLAEVKDQIKLETTPEGLRIQIIDNKNMPMFKSGQFGNRTPDPVNFKGAGACY